MDGGTEGGVSACFLHRPALHLLGLLGCWGKGDRICIKSGNVLTHHLLLESLPSPVAAIHRKHHSGDTWFLGNHPFRGLSTAGPPVIGNQLQWTFSSLPQLLSLQVSPYRLLLLVKVNSLSPSELQCKAGFHHKNVSLLWCPLDL